MGLCSMFLESKIHTLRVNYQPRTKSKEKKIKR